MKFQLVTNWRLAPRMLSMWCFAMIAGLSAAWGFLDKTKAAEHVTIAVFAIVGAILRLVAQPSVQEEKDADSLGL